MWREIDGLRHQSVGQLRVKYLEVFRLESRSNNQKFLDFQKGLRSSNPQLRLFGDKDSALPCSLRYAALRVGLESPSDASHSWRKETATLDCRRWELD